MLTIEPPPLSIIVRDRQLAQQEQGVEVDVDDLAEVGRSARPRPGTASPMPGVVHQHVEAPDRLRSSSLDQALAGPRRRPRRTVTGTIRSPQLGGQRLEPVGAPGRDDHGGAGGVQHAGEAVARARPTRR